MTTRVKKTLLFTIPVVLLLFITLGIVVCNRAGNENVWQHSEENKIKLSDREVMSHATHIVDAVYIGEQVTEYGTELIFSPVNEIKGVLEGEDKNLIYVQPMEKSSHSFNAEKSAPYVEDRVYMLFLEKNISVYNTHNKYVQIGEMIVSAEDEQWEKYHTQANDVAALTRDKTPSEYGVLYSDSTELAKLIDLASNIFVVKVTGIYAESTHAPTTVYNCTVTKVIKGIPAENGNILITFFNDTVKTGEEYLVLLADATETAPVYTLSSQNDCVYPMNDAKSISELELLLEQATDFLTTGVN